MSLQDSYNYQKPVNFMEVTFECAGYTAQGTDQNRGCLSGGGGVLSLSRGGTERIILSYLWIWFCFVTVG